VIDRGPGSFEVRVDGATRPRAPLSLVIEGAERLPATFRLRGAGGTVAVHVARRQADGAIVTEPIDLASGAYAIEATAR
jgi:hypothetical protein